MQQQQNNQTKQNAFYDNLNKHAVCDKETDDNN